MADSPRSQRALVSALASLFIALVVVIAAMQGSGTPAVPGPDGGGSRQDDGAQASSGRLRGDAASTAPFADDEREAATIDDAAPTRPLPANARWVDVLVVDKATGAPAPGAQVHWHDDSAVDFLQADDAERWSDAMLALFRNPEHVASKAGWRVRADGGGKARVTIGKSFTIVGASLGATYGTLQIRGDEAPPAGGYRLELEPDNALSVRVVDDGGRPCAGIGIGLLATAAGKPDAAVAFSTPLAFCDADGRATLTRLLLRCRLDTVLGTPTSWGPNVEAVDDTTRLVWRVRPILPGSRDLGVAFDPTAPPTEPLQLRLPPTGRMTVRAELGGAPVKSMRRASIQLVLTEDENPNAERTQAIADAAGVARFPFVALGARLWVTGDANGGMEQTVDGPTLRGQDVEVVLRPPDDAAVVAGRLLDAGRQPMRHCKISVRAHGNDLRLNATARTDGDGGFVANLGAVKQPTPAVTLWIETRGPNAMPQRAELRERTVRSGREDLGDIVLGDAPTLVAGMVTLAGEPFAGDATLEVEVFTPSADATSVGRWRPLDDQYGGKDATGRFVIHSNQGPGRYRLAVTCAEALPIDPIEFPIGATAVTVALHPGAQLAAGVLLPPGAPIDQLRFTLVPSRPIAEPKRTGTFVLRSPRDAARDLTTRLRGDAVADADGRGVIRWDLLPPDTYTLRVEIWLQRREVLAIPGIVAPPPGEADPRLANIDLRDALRVVTLRVRTHDGGELADAHVTVFAASPTVGVPWRAMSLWWPPMQLLLAPEPYDLTVCVPGNRPALARGNAPTIDVRMEPWPLVTVRVAGAAELPPGTKVEARFVGPERPAVPFEDDRFGGDCNDHLYPRSEDVPVEDGVARLPIGDGPHTLRVAIANESARTDVDLPATITALPSQAEVAVAIPADAWQQALARLAKQPAETGPPQRIDPPR